MVGVMTLGLHYILGQDEYIVTTKYIQNYPFQAINYHCQWPVICFISPVNNLNLTGLRLPWHFVVVLCGLQGRFKRFNLSYIFLLTISELYELQYLYRLTEWVNWVKIHGSSTSTDADYEIWGCLIDVLKGTFLDSNLTRSNGI